jgi:hypothetical protein
MLKITRVWLRMGMGIAVEEVCVCIIFSILWC